MKNKQLMVSVLFLTFLGLACSFGHYNSPSTETEELLTESDPESSAGEIMIITPENKTYTQPDSGYYPATYGFESGKDEFEVGELGGPVTILPSLDGHNKIAAISDTSSVYGSYIKQIFNRADQNYGTLDFWVRTTNHGSNRQQYITFGKTVEPWSESYALFQIVLNLYGWNNRDDRVISEVPSLAANIWFHCKVDFECTTGGYTGLSQYCWRFTVNGIASDPLPYWNNVEEMDFVWFSTGSNPNGMTFYVDALDYSWNPDYQIGDNLNEGLLLSYDSSINLDWQGYSLDGQPNKTILGNSSIPLPPNGQHRLQVFGNDSLGIDYESNVRYFTYGTTPGIYINTPESRTYANPDSGYYPATHGFDNDISGSEPSGWEVRQPDGDGFIEVDATHAGHNQVLELRKTGGSDKAEVNKNFPDNATVGTFEFWLYKDTASGIDPTRMGLFGDDGSLQFGVQSGDLYRSSWYSKVTIGSGVFTANTWHHIRVDFDVSIGWQIQLDDTWYGSGYSFPFEETPTYLYRFSMSSIFSGDASNYGAWLDALDYSWHENYDVGDNLNEGVLVSYDNTTNLVWQGYSLDGQDNLTIYGDTTIPIPDDGQHHVQVFGNDSMGTMYQSEIRYFDVDVNPVDISIISPHLNDLYQMTPPDFEIYIDDPDLNSTWYSLDGIISIPFTGFTGTISQAEWNKFSNGTVTIGFYANDSINHVSYESVTVRKDVLGPIITVNSPQDDEVFGQEAPAYALSIVEFNLDSIWYSFDYGVTVLPLYSLSGTLDQAAWESKGGGTVPIRFYANDSLGQESIIDVLVVKDLIFPIVKINSPDSGEVFGSTSPDYDISITESHLESCWYTLDGGTTNVTVGSLTGTISQTEWNEKGNGTVMIRFYARDEGGNEAHADIVVRKDINVPLITINSPIMLAVTGYNAPDFDLSIIETNLDSIWYTLDDGTTTYPISAFSGTIDSTEWNKFGEGMITIKFYAEDIAGNQAFAEVQVEKDLTKPLITINQPEIGDVFEAFSPIYSITIDDKNLLSYWYSMDGGITNISISELTGTISESEWDNLPNGHLTIWFYAKDEGGNVGSASVLITKNAPEEPPPAIPGYELYLILGVISVITTLIIRKRLKS